MDKTVYIATDLNISMQWISSLVDEIDFGDPSSTELLYDCVVDYLYWRYDFDKIRPLTEPEKMMHVRDIISSNCIPETLQVQMLWGLDTYYQRMLPFLISLDEAGYHYRWDHVEHHSGALAGFLATAPNTWSLSCSSTTH